ncbi:IS3 family transposase [Mesomycoplasma ovipneumoniae]|uniref:IS3 family transposase n=1 Tax=Mesomycoplasma ovipneumoniae TaxID=29562 RepID=UPI0028A7B0AD|nr:IS3 family transposase [Mesomycoplasma ovipneumoniae]WNM14296.1 IS3 family transposase [Mesomycoplasma ovipneumoniae]
MIYKIYNEFGLKQTINYINDISPDTNFITRDQLVRRIKKIIRYYNNGMQDQLLDKKGARRKPGSGKPKKQIEPNWNKFTKEELIEIAKRYYETNKDKSKSGKLSEAKTLNIPYTNLQKFLMYADKQWQKSKTKVIKVKEHENDAIIKKSFLDNKGRYGGLRFSAYISMKYNINIHPRSLGRHLKRLNLVCKIRKKEERAKLRTPNSHFRILLNATTMIKLNRNIFATDITYIKAPRDVKENHVFLSVIIEHKLKKSEIFKLSVSNDLNLVMENIKTFRSIDKNFVIHSDHGFQYTSKTYIDKINKMGGTVSLSRIGNSLDNREAEYWFSIIKSECLNKLNYSKITFEDLKKIIADYIFWYNNYRIQSIFKLKNTTAICYDVIIILKLLIFLVLVYFYDTFLVEPVFYLRFKSQLFGKD